MGKELSVIAKGASFIFAGFAISKVFALIYRVLLARWLGPEEFGIFSIGYGVLAIFSIFSSLGLYQGILHFVAIYDSTLQKEKIKGTILFGLKAQLISSLFFAAAMFISSDWLAVSFFREPELSIVLKLFAIALPFFILTSTMMILTQAFKKIKYKVYLRSLIENIAKVALTAIFLFLGWQLFGVTLAIAVSAVFSFVISLYIVQKKVFPLFGSKLKAKINAKELFAYSWPLLAVGFFYVLMSSIDTIMLGYFSLAYDAGIYNVAHPVANFLTVASTAFGTLFLPVITGIYAQKKMAEFEKTFKVVTRWIFLITFPCLLFTILFASDILAVLFGEVYATGAGALIILSFGVFIGSFMGGVGPILESIKKTKLIFVNTVICGLLNVFLNFWLITLFKASGNAIIGAALATAFSYFLWNLLALIEVYAVTRVHPYNRAYFVPTITACIAIALLVPLKNALPPLMMLNFPIDFIVLSVLGIGFLAVYGLLFIVFRGLQSDDLDILRAIEKKTGFRAKLLRNFVKKFS